MDTSYEEGGRTQHIILIVSSTINKVNINLHFSIAS